MGTLNLGILAHVDAGKTTLTERLLYDAGAISAIGSVDEGTTQTDTLALERERGITIRSAVASFVIGDRAVNLIDTPGHPDFIAEVERVLGVLDGAVLVISSVEGVQPQTPLLFRALQRLRLPTLIFVNKIDRSGADDRRVLDAIAARLTRATLPMGVTSDLGTRQARFEPAAPDDAEWRAAATEVLAEVDEGVMAAFVEGSRALPSPRLREVLAEQTATTQIHPVYFGSAVTGAGVDALRAGIEELLPLAGGDPDAPLAGRAFKIERTATGERVAYVRVFAGALRVRDRVPYGHGRDSERREGRVTALSVFAPGGPVQRSTASPGDIARVSGLAEIRVGDVVGQEAAPGEARAEHFAPPTLESVVVPVDAAEGGRLRAALNELAEQDPLIDVRQDDVRGEIWVSLYGEVQKEVIGETLARDYGIEVGFRETTTICVERPVGTGEALEILYALTHSNVTGKSSPHSTNPFVATLGLRIEPKRIRSGIEVRLDVDVRLIPLYIYKTVEAFEAHLGEYVRDALREGLFGWEVTDCLVTVTDCGYRGPGTNAADFRRVVPLVLMQALERAGTEVCEPMLAARLDLPADAVSGVLSLLARLSARPEPPMHEGGRSTIEAVLPAARVHELQHAIPGLTGGEGSLETRFAGYLPVAGRPPTRPRTTPDPRDRDSYLSHLRHRVT